MRLVFLIVAQISLVLAAGDAAATTVFVTDQFEITLRSGESAQHSIVRMLNSGTPLEVVAADPGNGYTQVRTQGGTEGYVLTRFVMPEPAARAQLEQLRARLARADNEQGGMSRQVDELVQRNAEAERKIAELESSASALSAELDRIQAISANAIQLDRNNRRLTGELESQAATIASLSDENKNLRDANNRKWFVAGGGLVLFSMLFGIMLTRIRWRKRSSWSDF